MFVTLFVTLNGGDFVVFDAVSGNLVLWEITVESKRKGSEARSPFLFHSDINVTLKYNDIALKKRGGTMNLGKETETLEYKKTTGEMNGAMISIASILNKHGVGTLYFGVKPNGEAVGQDVSESSLRSVSRSIYDHIKPQIYPVVEEVVIDDKHLIKVEFSGENVPYSAAGRYYLRVADEDKEVRPEELRAFFSANKSRGKWERETSAATAKQIDKSAIKAFWQKAVSVGRLPEGHYTCPIVLNRFGLLSGDHLTNAGEILFGNTRPVPLKMGIFATEEKLTILDMKFEEDNVFNLLPIAESYILRNIRWKSKIVRTEREEIPEIPVAVIREVLANGFAHAIYNGRTVHEICIHPGMVTIYSPGEYASKFTPEEYIKGNFESEIRNPTIAKFLYLNKSIEQFGSGFKRINSLCTDSGVKYSYRNNENGFKFILYRPQIQNDMPEPDLDASLNMTEMVVLAVLKRKPDSSRAEIAEKISKTVRTVQRTLESLRNKGYIIRIGSKMKPVWKVLK
ncbi:MAG: putative DNA binding domain-containing protein [Thermoguttaceae bacterium]|nr:putative DNA binding domain-containing protein [Thermoguttaceae bacterium]MCR5358712.1 putative DNA binding domain-containing protein [Thermoguttaceae bacterium]